MRALGKVEENGSSTTRYFANSQCNIRTERRAASSRWHGGVLFKIWCCQRRSSSSLSCSCVITGNDDGLIWRAMIAINKFPTSAPACSTSQACSVRVPQLGEVRSCSIRWQSRRYCMCRRLNSRRECWGSRYSHVEIRWQSSSLRRKKLKVFTRLIPYYLRNLFLFHLALSSLEDTKPWFYARHIRHTALVQLLRHYVRSLSKPG